MSEDTDYHDLLDENVDEAEEKIKDLEDPDYEELLEAEKDGRDRKTIKEFIQSQMPDSDGEDESEGSEADEETPESDQETESREEEVVEEIEEETSDGLLGSFSPTSVLAGGLILGIVIGFASATVNTGPNTDGADVAPSDLVRDSVETAYSGLTNENVSVSVSEPARRNSMYNMNVTITSPGANTTRERTQEIFVTLDGKYLFQAQKAQGTYLRPANLNAAVQRAKAPRGGPSAQSEQQSQEQAPESTSETSDPQE